MTLTKMQVAKRMREAGITGELTGRGEKWQVILDDDAAFDKFQAHVCKVGGSNTGWGGWVLRPNREEMGDWNDKTSKWHY